MERCHVATRSSRRGGAVTKRGAREFRRYIDITLGSLSELSYAIRAVKDLGLGTADDVQRLDALRQQAGKVTWGLYRRVCAKAGEQRC